MEHIGQIIKQARSVHGLTQAELARRVGISRGYLSEIETKGANISHNLACLFMRELHISPAEFNSGMTLDTERQIIIGQLRQLRDELNEIMPPTEIIAKEQRRILDVVSWAFVAYNGDLDRICRHCFGMNWEFMKNNYGAVQNPGQSAPQITSNR